MYREFWIAYRDHENFEYMERVMVPYSELQHLDLWVGRDMIRSQNSSATFREEE